MLRIEMVTQGTQGTHADLTLLGTQPRRVVAPDTMLVTDGSAVRDDGIGRRPLECLPARQCRGVIGTCAIEISRIDAGPLRIQVREMRERQHLLTRA